MFRMVMPGTLQHFLGYFKNRDDMKNSIRKVHTSPANKQGLDQPPLSLVQIEPSQFFQKRQQSSSSSVWSRDCFRVHAALRELQKP